MVNQIKPAQSHQPLRASTQTYKSITRQWPLSEVERNVSNIQAPDYGRQQKVVHAHTSVQRVNEIILVLGGKEGTAVR